MSIQFLWVNLYLFEGIDLLAHIWFRDVLKVVYLAHLL